MYTPVPRAKRTTKPADPAVSLPKAKNQCQIAAGVAVHDDDLLQLIDVATAEVEFITRTALLQGQFVLLAHSFPRNSRDGLRLYHVNADAVLGVSYLDINDDSQTLDLADVYLETNFVYPELRLQDVGTAWPQTSHRADAVTVTYQAGAVDRDELAATLEGLRLQQAVQLRVHALWLRANGQQADDLDRKFHEMLDLSAVLGA